MSAEPAILPAGLVELALDEIVESPDNPRKHFDATFVAQMASSMREVGQISPVLVRPHPAKENRYELVAGATRLRAAKAAGLATLRAVVEPMDDAKFLKAMTFENLKRRDLRPLEEARGYALLMKRLDGYTPEKIAGESGVSVDYVRDRVRLLRLSERAQQLLEQESIDLGHALELAKLNTKDQARTIKDGLFVRVTAAQQSELLKLERAPTQKPVTVHELRAWIDRHVLADLSHPDLPDLYPETARLLAQKTEKLPQVFIATGYVLPEVKKGVEVLTPANWRRADGQRGSKTCERPKKIGVVAASDAARSQAFLICTSKVCPVHFPEQVKRAAQRAKAVSVAGTKGKPAPSAAETEKRSKDRAAKEEAARKARAALLEAAAPAIKAQLLLAIAKAKPEVLLPDLLERFDWEMRDPETKAMIAALPAKDVAGTIRRLWLLHQREEREMVFDAWGLEHALPKICQRFGVDVAAIVRDASPTKHLRCLHCGCTEAKACKGGCAWVSTNPPVCSNPKCVKANTATTPKVKAPAATEAPPKKRAAKRRPDKQFMAPVTPDAVLGAIVGTAPMPRTELTKKLWAHISKHGLQDKKNRRMINAGTTLTELFGGQKQVSMFDMTKLVTKHVTTGARA